MKAIPDRRPDSPDLSPLRLEEVIPALRRQNVSWTLQHHNRCGSTQDLAREALAEGRREGLVVVAEEQAAGRGRRGAAWVAPARTALLFSVVLTPRPDVPGVLPLLVGIAVAEGVERATGLRPDLKWPNDLLLGDRKLAGILVERPPGPAVIVGIGINVNLPPAGLPPGATSLRVATGTAVPREPLLVTVLDCLDAAYGRLREEGAGWVVPAWRSHSSMLGQPVAVTTAGQFQTVIAADLDDQGGLIVEFSDGSRQVLTAGQVDRVRNQ